MLESAESPRRRRPPAAGKGRKPGVKNKIGRDVQELVLQALDKAGGLEYLVEQAHKNPVAFMHLVAKLLPRDVNLKGEGLTIRINLMGVDDDGQAVRNIGGLVPDGHSDAKHPELGAAWSGRPLPS